MSANREVFDHLGRRLSVGDYVAISRGSDICVGRLEKICKTVIKVSWALRSKQYRWFFHCRPNRVIRLDASPELTMYYLRASKE